ncbi:MAG: dockerin type I repeat-containing protein [Oscillospiraceae bacterium]|nr:dockerin type I repeat-containing protein [Oscillospiraceae bacterium]
MEMHETWFVIGSSETLDDQNLTVLLVSVPKTAQPGDSFEITFLSRSVAVDPSTALPAYCTRWDDDDPLIHYQSADEFEGFNGGITITEPEPTEPEPTEPEPTEPPVTEPTEPELYYTLGDVKVDGVVNSKDAAIVLQAAARIGTNLSHGLTKAQYAAADTNRDGTINAQDASQILQYAAQTGTGYNGSMEDYLGY